MGIEQLAFDFKFFKPPSSEMDEITIGERTLKIAYVPNVRARRYLLYVRKDGSLRITLPRRGTQKKAFEFITRQKRWIERQLLKLEAGPIVPKEWSIGTQVFLRGEQVTLELAQEGDWIQLGLHRIGKPPQCTDFRLLVETFLFKLASHELKKRAFELASLHELRVKKVSVRNQNSRWGSCSHQGAISLNWRLIQMPDDVRDYVILHELMHIKELNHSPRFWRLVEAACPAYSSHQDWIKQYAARLGM